jgi:hypothetical protein
MRYVHSDHKVIFYKILLVLIVPLWGSFAHAGSYLVFAAWSLFGPRRALEALTLTWLITFLNPGIYSISSQGDFLRWLVIGTSFISVLTTMFVRKIPPPRSLLWLLAFIGVSGLLSVIVSYAPDVSLFKLLSFGLVSSTVLIGYRLTRHESSYWQDWFISLFVVVVFLSFCLIFSDFGYTRNQQGFQGILNHPQAYGIFIAPFLAWVLGLIFDNRLSGYFPWVVVLIASLSLFATQSRTGMLAVVVGFFLAVVFDSLRQSGGVRRGRQWVFRLMPFLLLGAIFVTVNVDVVRSGVSSFVLKGHSGDGIGDAFYSSRGSLLGLSLTNFQDNIFTGIGFGVASDPSKFNVSRDPYLGLPIGASVEKGFSIVAALEEVGLIGFTLLIALIGSILRPTLGKQSGIAPSALAFGALFVNFGESIFFSVGGIGLLMWLLLGVAQIDRGNIHQ